MSAPNFVHLHVHSEYSLLDGMGRLPDMVKRAKELGMDCLALTDHGSMHGTVEFYSEATSRGVKPILGCEVYVAPGSRHERKPKSEGSPHHLVLLAMNETGYRNLLQLSSKGHCEGFYYKPRIDKELLAQYSGGLIALSACASGEIARLLRAKDLIAARKAATWYSDLFGRDRFFLEVQRHGNLPDMDTVNEEIVALAHQTGIPLVATNDAHYVLAEDATAHDVLLCIGTNNTIADANRHRMSDDSYYLKSPEEMESLFADIPEAIENTNFIASMCNLQLEFNRLHLPNFPIPDGFTPDSYLEKLCREGVRQRYQRVTAAIDERLRYELDVIIQTGFSQYILIVADFIRHARTNGILFGPRGSAAGSIVCYCLGISDVDPVGNKLVFERFLNIERKEMPDIDMDFADDQRDQMIEYAVAKYGRDHVAQIITFGTLGAKAAIRDVGRALGISYGDADRVAKLIPSLPVGITIDRALEENPELKQLYQADEPVKKLIDTARSLEGIARHSSTHAAGVVISHDPLVEHVPLQRATRSEDTLMTQYPMNIVAKIGLLKMDFLGLTNLTVLGRAVRTIREARGIDLDVRQLPLDNPKVFELLGAGFTANVFQLEGSGMTRYIKELKPTSIHDLAAMIALYRPGPLAHIPKYIRCKHGLEPVEYPHPLLEPLLEDTYGIIVYQDQVLQVVRAVAGYSLGQADILRKAMGKKVPEIMSKERSRFIQGAQANGLSEAEATKIFDIIEPFAGYAFNKSHAYCYALVAYRTAFLKANYPVEYMVAVLSTAAGNTEKVGSTMAECRRMNINILPPDINRSVAGFKIENTQQQAIRFGLSGIKNVGGGAIDALLAARGDHGELRTLEDFAQQVDLKAVNRRALESLIKAGAMDSFGKRSQLLAVIDQVIGVAQRSHQAAESGQTSMFDFMADDSFRPTITLPDIPETPEREKLAWEKELLGVYVSEHPMHRASKELRNTLTAFCGEIGEDLAGQKVTVAGMVKGMRQLITKKRDAMVATSLEDLQGTVEVVVFPKVYERTRDCWQEDQLLVVQGRVEQRGDAYQLVCEHAQRYEPRENEEGTEDEVAIIPDVQPLPKVGRIVDSQLPGTRAAVEPRRLILTFSRSEDFSRDVALLREVHALLLRNSGGQDVVELSIPANGHERVDIELPDLAVKVGPELERRLGDLLGSDAVKVAAIQPD